MECGVKKEIVDVPLNLWRFFYRSRSQEISRYLSNSQHSVAASHHGHYIAAWSCQWTVNTQISSSTEYEYILPFTPRPPPAAAYDLQRAAYVTGLADLSSYEVKRWGRGRIYEIIHSPFGDKIAVATSVGVWIYNLDEPDNGHFLPHMREVLSIAFSPDGERIVSGSTDSIVRVWDVASGEEVAQLAVDTGEVQAVAFSLIPLNELWFNFLNEDSALFSWF